MVNEIPKMKEIFMNELKNKCEGSRIKRHFLHLLQFGVFKHIFAQKVRSKKLLDFRGRSF